MCSSRLGSCSCSVASDQDAPIGLHGCSQLLLSKIKSQTNDHLGVRQTQILKCTPIVPTGVDNSDSVIWAVCNYDTLHAESITVVHLFPLLSCNTRFTSPSDQIKATGCWPFKQKKLSYQLSYNWSLAQKGAAAADPRARQTNGPARYKQVMKP